MKYYSYTIRNINLHKKTHPDTFITMIINTRCSTLGYWSKIYNIHRLAHCNQSTLNTVVFHTQSARCQLLSQRQQHPAQCRWPDYCLAEPHFFLTLHNWSQTYGSGFTILWGEYRPFQNRIWLEIHLVTFLFVSDLLPGLVRS